MSVHLGILYHWSPKINRAAILRRGLRVMSGSRLYPKNPDGTVFHGFPWICLGTTPSSAWGLILDPENDGDEGESGWDLWQVRIQQGDKIVIRSDFDVPYIQEVRVLHGLSPDRIWWVAERGLYAHESIGKPAPEPPPGSLARRRRKILG